MMQSIQHRRSAVSCHGFGVIQAHLINEMTTPRRDKSLRGCAAMVVGSTVRREQANEESYRDKYR